MTALALCRFAHFAAAMLVFGAAAFLRLEAPADLGRALSPRTRPLAIAGSLVALATACLWLAAAAASMADDPAAAVDPATVATVLTDTAFGRAWIAHLLLAAALTVAALVTRERWTAVAVLSGLLLASLGLVGHAAMQAGLAGIAHRAIHATHLLAAGAWLGGLVPFLACLTLVGRPTLRGDAVTAMMRFSFRGHFVVAALVATGIADVALTSGRLPLPPTTPYRALLDVKIGLVALMIVLALVNRYVLVPRIRTSARALPALRTLSLANVALGAIVVALVSVFALLDPA